MLRHFAYLIPLLVLLSACTKYDVSLVEGEPIPEDATISSALQESYVNRLYINLLGRKPDEVEQARALAILDQENSSEGSRRALIRELFAHPDYHANLFRSARADLIGGTTLQKIELDHNRFYSRLNDPEYTHRHDLYAEYVSELGALLSVQEQLDSGQIGAKQVHRRCSNNLYYDQLNMGSENFVVSVFQYFLFRYPTQSELAASVKMVEGEQALLFLEAGSSKENFLRIFFNSNAYIEGQVRTVFKKYLSREPDAQELYHYTVQYAQTLDYAALQEAILVSEEYLRF